MAERKQSGKAAEDEEVPAFFKNLGSGSPKPRQKFCGMFCPVEGSSENKTIDFDSLSVGRGSGQVVAQQRDVAHLGPDPQSPYSRQGRRPGEEPSVESSRKVEIRRASGKEALQNIYDQAPPGTRLRICTRPPRAPLSQGAARLTVGGRAPTKAARDSLGLGAGGSERAVEGLREGPRAPWGSGGAGVPRVARSPTSSGTARSRILSSEVRTTASASRTP
ncbi:uncharacterized protein LOC111816624 [Octodon degus]|uniref:Uncharacterized protein LOC111816624 n=1 Tax=Octodon degus TaxID=10160 RepID=A0A6P6EE99_OCTDE|nr:uncharacterized protein LOC111816624 [Octodon degus]